MDINQKKNWTVIDIINWGTDFFRLKGIESPRLCIELLLCHILNFERIDIYLQHDKPLTQSELDSLRDLVKRKAEREPIQYIIGKTQFYGLEFKVNKNVLIPRPETEILVEEVLKYKRNFSEPKILDIGAGCGNISICIAKNWEEASVIGIDKSEEAVKLSIQNSNILKIENIKFELMDIMENIPSGKYDLIVSNPPYIKKSEYVTLMPEVLKYEPSEALTDNKDGLTFYRRFAELLPSLLNNNGMYFLEIGYGQSEKVSELMTKSGLKFDFIEDFNKIRRVISGFKYT
ncbi:MAG: peptide chain release factor N(5)-glutamine methyltransferase [Ignavibacteriae bacterium]|nr:peptide chain release factor N(5)-glutamine methyltransferase [Ignavibacteriota bacterium]